ncbi:MAG: phenylalanine--tRNA ligase beta subunit-related protein [Pseudomonadota bacterium]
MTAPITFSLDQFLAEAGVSVAFVYASGEPTDALNEGAKIWRAAQQAITNMPAPEALLQHSHIRGYRLLHDKCGVSDPALIPSPESLITLLLSAGELRSIDPIVDLYNAISLKHLVSVGAHDADKLGGELSLSMNSGEERFLPIGQKKKITLPRGEYSYKALNQKPVCRLECKQSNETKLRPESKRWVFILQGNEKLGADVLQSATDDLLDLLDRHWANLSAAQSILHLQNLVATLQL